MLRPGDAAPDFVLKDHEGKDLRLSSLGARPIVLYFFPRDGFPGCVIESRRFAEIADRLEAHDAQVVGVCLGKVEDNAAFRAEHRLPFPIVSDPEGRVHDLYEAWRTTLFGRIPLAVRRCTYLIDDDGIIRRVYRVVNVLSHARQILKDLDRLKAQNLWGKVSDPPKKQA